MPGHMGDREGWTSFVTFDFVSEDNLTALCLIFSPIGIIYFIGEVETALIREKSIAEERASQYGGRSLFHVYRILEYQGPSKMSVSAHQPQVPFADVSWGQEKFSYLTWRATWAEEPGVTSVWVFFFFQNVLTQMFSFLAGNVHWGFSSCFMSSLSRDFPVTYSCLMLLLSLKACSPPCLGAARCGNYGRLSRRS